jgi:hypothetical protein
MSGTIDLGLDRVPPSLDDRRGLSLPRLRHWRSPGLLTLLLALVLGTASPEGQALPPSPLTLVAEHEAVGDYRIVGDVLLTTEATPDRDDVTGWSAYQLPSGVAVWSTPDELVILPGAADLIVTYREGAGGQQWSFLDPASGAVLWSVTGRVEPVEGGAAMLVTRSPRPGGPDWWLREVAVIDATTGDSSWKAEVDDDWRVLASAAGVVLINSSGAVEVRDIGTGELRASGRVPGPEDDYGHWVVGDALVVVDHFGAAGQPRVHAYDLGTLALRWEAPVGPPGAQTAWSARISQDSFYWHTGASSGVLDFRTGASYAVEQQRAGDVLLLAEAVVFRDSAARPREVVNRRTGEVIASLDDWQLVEPHDETGHLLLTRPIHDTTMLARLDLTSGDLTYVGIVPAPLARCHTFDDGVVCRGPTLTVWRWR